jgi:glutathione reductase (NADPH)
VTQFDVVVLGVGMAGLSAAHRLAAAGKRVAVVDSRPYGGTCALRGCDPKKVLVGAAELVDWQRRMHGHGVSGELRIDWKELMAFKRTFTESTPANLERGLENAGVETLHGRTAFRAENRLEVDGAMIESERFLIATGAKPRELEIPGAELAVTSADFLELEELPRQVLFIGGGYVSFEFAHIAARAGAEVTILDRNERPLRAFDPDMVSELVTASEELGIELRFETEVTEIAAEGSERVVHTGGGDAFRVDLVVHGAGRVPEIGDLELAAAGVEHDEQRGVHVSEHLQSVSNPRVYAAGDAAATDGWPLTPVAVHEGLIAASNILKGNRRTANYVGTPSVVFTMPALARVGLTEAEAEEQRRSFRVERGDMSGWYTARRTREEHAAYKVLIDEETDAILGAHLLGAHAGEVIDMFALAVRHGLTARDVKTSILVHPAAASDVAYML